YAFSQTYLKSFIILPGYILPQWMEPLGSLAELSSQSELQRINKTGGVFDPSRGSLDLQGAVPNPSREHTKSASQNTERKHTCTLCLKSFKKSHHLTYHLSSHSNERPNMCTYCNKGFKIKHHLKRHVKNKHADQLRLDSQFPQDNSHLLEKGAPE
ncbi:unnamed protein product, partial [Owenia fusiformis]